MNVHYFVSHPPCLAKVMRRHYDDSLATFFANYCFLDYCCAVRVKIAVGSSKSNICESSRNARAKATLCCTPRQFLCASLSNPDNLTAANAWDSFCYFLLGDFTDFKPIRQVVVDVHGEHGGFLKNQS